MASGGQHLIDNTFARAEAGGCLASIAGSGRLDLVLADDYKGREVYWWECPRTPPQPWPRRTICHMPANQSHDQMIADVDGDGRPELYFWNQQASALFCVPVPDDPRVSPWPGLHAVAGGLKEEGLCVADVDGDGKLELIAGLSWYRPLGGRLWERHEFARGFVSPKSVAADFDGDGRPEIVISEGDASLNRREFGRVVLFKAGPARRGPLGAARAARAPAGAALAGGGRLRRRRPARSLRRRDGPARRPDPHPPALRIYQNLGGGQFAEHVIDEGVGTHEAKVIVLDGRVGIAGKPFRLQRARRASRRWTACTCGCRSERRRGREREEEEEEEARRRKGLHRLRGFRDYTDEGGEDGEDRTEEKDRKGQEKRSGRHRWR